jgi:hypothetical protein
VGCVESRVIGVGPQIGHMFKISEDYQGYVNLKGYKEFDAARALFRSPPLRWLFRFR